MITSPALQFPCIVARFPTRESLRAAIHGGGHVYELVLEGRSDVSAAIGSIVRVSVEVLGHPAVDVEAVATWRRKVARPGLPAAMGLRLDARAAARLVELRPVTHLEDDVRDVLAWRAKGGA